MVLPSQCIWCESTPADSWEHIIPEALGCPPALILSSGVCRACNHANGRLDRALLKPFELMTVVRGIPRKKGKRPSIDGYSTISSDYRNSGLKLYINREKYAIDTPSGKKLGPTSAIDHFHDVTLEKLPGGRAKLEIKQRLQFDRKAVRGLFKIALESIALHQGAEAALDAAFDGVRRYVRYDEGNYSAVMTIGDPYDAYLSNPWSKDGRPPIIGMSILKVGFLCDFDPEFAGGMELMAAASQMGEGSFRLPN